MKTLCDKKIFHSKPDAIKALHSIKNKKDSKHKECRAYECEICKGKWHLTSAPLINENSQEVKQLSFRADWLKILNNE